MLYFVSAEELTALANDLVWTWDQRIRNLFSSIDPRLWEESGESPVRLLRRLGPEQVEAVLTRPEVRAALAEARRALSQYHSRPLAGPVAPAPLRIGYFSLEFGLDATLPIYSGGLGILAGDHLKAASDLGLPLAGVGLLYRFGYGRQRLDEAGRQVEEFSANHPAELPVVRQNCPDGRPLTVTVPIVDTFCRVAVWRAQVGRVPLYLLDTDLDENPPDLRAVTDRLYGSEPDHRLKQEIVLGIGGLRALEALGFDPTVTHINEGHGFLVAVERIRRLLQRRRVTVEEARLLTRPGHVFTTHTPEQAGSDYFHPGLVHFLLGPYLESAGIPFDRFLALGRHDPHSPDEPLCTTLVALRLSGRVFGVSRIHGSVSKRLWRSAWPDLEEQAVPIGAVTNGVHLPTWVGPEVAAALSRHLGPDWWDLDADDPRWQTVESIPDQELWAAHQAAKRRMLDRIRRSPGDDFDPAVLTIGFARRFATYKRAYLLLQDRDRLARILDHPERPVQLIFAGKAHPADWPGKDILHQVVTAARDLGRIAFLPDYDMRSARWLVQGCDLWLNTPRRFREASGTSGMKAGANGVLNCSTPDGWWDEGYRPEIGWRVASPGTCDRPDSDDQAEAADLYRLLEEEIIPLYYEREGSGPPVRWLNMMRASIRYVAAEFSARRMVLEYAGQAYVPAAVETEAIRLTPDWPA